MIRLATPADAPAVHAIYAPVVRDTAISFEWEVPAVAELAHRIDVVLQTRPWLVYERAAEVLGYVYAGSFRDRFAYRWGTEVAVYIRADARGRGIGRGLYTALFDVLRLQGYCYAVAGATLPNRATERLHESMGFGRIGVFAAAGFKFGRWHDVIFWQLALRPPPPTPPELMPVGAVVNDPAWRAALERGATLITRI